MLLDVSGSFMVFLEFSWFQLGLPRRCLVLSLSFPSLSLVLPCGLHHVSGLFPVFRVGSFFPDALSVFPSDSWVLLVFPGVCVLYFLSTG